MTDVGNKLWGFCHTLRHDGIDYGDYIEQITYLLFLKMMDERGQDLSRCSFLDAEGEEEVLDCSWPALASRSGTALLEHYENMLRALGKQKGTLGDIYAGAQSRFSNPVNLKKLIGLIDEVEWTSLGVDVKASAYEDLLEKAASEGKKGAGQYFTPRVLIEAIVRCVKPDPRVHPEFTVCDPAVGTGGFLVAAYEWLVKPVKEGGVGAAAMARDTALRVKRQTYFGNELVPRPRRLALMNLLLHGVEPHIKLGDTIYEPFDDRFYDVILTNPPFGTRGANQAPEREDFTIETSNKQLNFLQHIIKALKPGGRAAVVLPDNCLFADQAGEVFEILTHDCDLHTVLRLPRGTFTPYSPGVKANVVFFTKGPPSERTWIYDARTNVPSITKKDRPLTEGHFMDFERCFGADPNGRAARSASDSADSRWRVFHISEVKERNYKLDSLKWLREESVNGADELPEPEELATDAIAELESAVEELNSILAMLESETVPSLGVV